MRLNRLLLLVLLTISAFAQSKPVPPPPPITYEQAVANERNLFAADQKHDMKTIQSIVADEFVDINKDGSPESKPELLQEIPTLKLLDYAQKNFSVISMGPYAYSIAYDSDATVIDAKGKQVHAQNRLNSVWIWRDGRWQMLMHCRGEQKAVGGQ